MSTHELDVYLLVGAVVLLVSIAAVRLAVGSGLPTLLLYLGLGLVLGENALGLEFDDTTLARSLGYAALVVILARGVTGKRCSSASRRTPAISSRLPNQ